MRSSFLLSLTLLVACGQDLRPLPGSGALAHAVQPEGKFHVVVIDVSESMDANDPRHYNEMGGHLAVALAGSMDNLGAVAFGSRAYLLAPLRSIDDKAGRRRLHDELNRAPRRGQTNYVDALRWSFAIFEAANAPAGATAIFLTDGRHNVGGTEGDVMGAVRRFRDRDWRIFTIGLTEGGESPLLKKMALETRGAHFPVSRAEDLMEAFLVILGQIHNFMFFDGSPEPVHLMAGTSRFVYVVIKKSRDATVGSVIRNGLALDPKSPHYYKYPESLDTTSDLEIVSIENPPPGVWDIALQGDARVGAILQRPPFNVRLDERHLLSEYYEGETIRLSLLIEGGDREVAGYIRERGRASAVLRSQLTFKDTASVDLNLGEDAPGPITFVGRAPARTSRGETEIQTIVARFTLPEKGGGVWRREVRVSVLCHPGPRPVALRVSPAEVDLGARWWDSGPASAEIGLIAARDPLEVVVAPGSPTMRVSQERVTVTTTGARFNVTVDPVDLPAGAYESWVELAAPERYRVPVRMRVGRLTGRIAEGEILVRDATPGKPWEVPLELSQGIQAKVTPLTGPGTIQARAEAGKISGTLPADAKEGEYSGKILLQAAGFPERQVPLRVQVKAARATLSIEPKEVTMEADKPGTYEKVIRLKLTHPRAAQCVAEPGNLKAGEATIRSAFVSLAPEESEWDGRTLPQDKEVRATVRVKVKSDHLNGDYSGKIVITLPGVGDPVEVVVRVKVRQ